MSLKELSVAERTKPIEEMSLDELLAMEEAPPKRLVATHEEALFEKRLAEEEARAARTLKVSRLSPEEMAKARETVKEAKDVIRPVETPEGPTKLYSGIPVEEMITGVKRGLQGLLDALGIPAKGKVSVVPPARAEMPGVLTHFMSPSVFAEKLVKKFPQLAPYVEDGKRAMYVQERLRSVFRRRLLAIDKVLAEDVPFAKDPARRIYKRNKEQLDEILLVGDMLGKRFTAEELRSVFDASESVVKAYKLMRAAYDHAHKIASRVKELRGKEPPGYRVGYIPHFFHNWFIVADGKVVYSARTLREAVKTANPLSRQGKKVTIFPKEFEFPSADIHAVVLGDMAYFRLRAELAKNFSLSIKQAQELLQGIARMKGRSRFVGNFLQRKGVPGWETNLDWVHRHYFNMISRYAALDRFKARTITRFERQFGPWSKEYRGIANYIKKYFDDVNGTPTHVEDLLNSTIARIPFVNKFFGNFFGDRPSLQLATMTTNAVAVAKLGLYNVSAALVNGTQLINVAVKLGEKAFFDGLRRAAKPTAKERGLLKQMGVDIALGLEAGAGYSRAAQMGRLFRNSTWFFQQVETYLRSVAGLGAYYQAVGKGMTHRQAISYAKKIVEVTNFDYSIADAPAFIRRSGPLGQVLFQFKKFPVKQMEFWTQLNAAQHVKFWIPWLLLSGYYGIPLAEATIKTVKSRFDIDLELELKNYLSKWAEGDKTKKAIAKGIMYGAFGNAGIDVSRRIGAGDFVPTEPRHLWGPAVSSVVSAAQLAAKQHWVEALRAITSAPGNIALALKNDGEILDPWRRERLKIKLTPRERVIKAAGFMPERESWERDVSRIIRYEEQKRRRKEYEAIDGFLKAVKEKNVSEIDKWATKLAELQVDPRRVAEEARKKGMTPSQRAIRQVPKKRVMEYRHLYAFR